MVQLSAAIPGTYQGAHKSDQRNRNLGWHDIFVFSIFLEKQETNRVANVWSVEGFSGFLYHRAISVVCGRLVDEFVVFL